MDASYISSTLDFINTFTAASRALTVQTTDRTTYNNPSEYSMRWKTTDELSGMDTGTVYQEFVITVQYCFKMNGDAFAKSRALDWLFVTHKKKMDKLT